MKIRAIETLKRLVLFALAVIFSGPVQAQDSLSTNAQDLARAFVGYCVQNAGRNDKVEAAAREFEFKELEGDMKAMLAPQDPSIEYSGWLVAENGQVPYPLGVSDSLMKDVGYSNCSLAYTDVEIDEVLEELRLLVAFGRVIDEREESGQRYRVWEVEEVAERSLVSVLDAPRMGVVGGSITLMAPTAR